MAVIYVKAKEGRRAYFEGRVIPQDKFIPVTDTPYIRRLRDHWEDLEQEGTAQPKGKAPAPAKPVEKPSPVTTAQTNDLRKLLPE